MLDTYYRDDMVVSSEKKYSVDILLLLGLG